MVKNQIYPKGDYVYISAAVSFLKGRVDGDWHRAKQKLEGKWPYTGHVLNKKWPLLEKYEMHLLHYQQV